MNKQESPYKLIQMERFWTDDTNKENLQEITTKCFEKKSLGNYFLSVYLSNKNNNTKCVQIINGFIRERPDLGTDIKKVHLTIIPHFA